MISRLLLVCIFSGLVIPSGGAADDTVSQYGITWKFDRKVTVGQFVNGDYYVIGPVTVLEVTPAPSGTGKGLRNGSMLNPPVTGYNAYDGRFPNGFRQELITPYPVDLKPGDSLVSTISLERGQPIEKLPGNESGKLRASAVLTCLKEAVPVDAFRPGYCDPEKNVIHRAGDIRWELLPTTVALATIQKKPTWSWAELERAFDRSWLDHVYGWESRDLHPSENMPGYGQQVVRVVSMAALMLCSDAPKEQKSKLCQRMIQVGIDNWAIAKRGKPGASTGWPAAGGFGSGRKFPIVFAAVMLQDREMLELSKHAPNAAFGEDDHTEFGRCWTGANVRFRGQFPASAQSDRGPYEHLWPGLWPGPDHTMSEGYRRANTSNSWPGVALATLLMKAEKIWNHEAFFAYTDRWMGEDDTEQVQMIKTAISADYNKDWSRQTHCFDDDWIEEVWRKYRQSPGLPPVAEFRQAIPEEGTVQIGSNREFIAEGKKLLPLMLFVQPQVALGEVKSHAAEVFAGKAPPAIFAQADAQIQDAVALGANTLFVNGDVGVTNWAFHAGQGYMERIAANGLYGVMGADTEIFGHRKLLGLTHEDQPDRSVAMLPKPPWPKRVNVTMNRPTRPHGAPGEVVNPYSTEAGVLLENMLGAEITVTLERPVTVSSLAVWLRPDESTFAPKELVFLADGAEILTASLEKKKDKQVFKLAAPASFKELRFRVAAVHPGKVDWGFIKQVGAFDEHDQQVWLYAYDPQLRSVEKVACVYAWMRSLQKTRPVFLAFSPGFMKSSPVWDPETRQGLYPEYLKQCDVAGFVQAPGSVSRIGTWLTRLGEGVSELSDRAGPGRPIVFWLEMAGPQDAKPAALAPAQVRAAAWTAIIHGATAIGYRAPLEKNRLAMDAPAKAALKELNDRISGLSAAILADPARLRPDMTMSENLSCRCKATESEGSMFVFAINLGIGKDEVGTEPAVEPRGGKALFRMAALQAGTQIEVVGEGRSITAAAGEFSDDFAPLAEHIYKLPGGLDRRP